MIFVMLVIPENKCHGEHKNKNHLSKLLECMHACTLSEPSI
jgi:hypothetical protein